MAGTVGREKGREARPAQPEAAEPEQTERDLLDHEAVRDERRRAEEELRQAHALIEGITQGTEDLIAAQNTDFRYLFFNEAYRREFERLWGRDIEVGTSMIEALAPWPEEQRKARDLWRRALEGESFSVTMAFGPSEEHQQVYDLRFNPVYDAEGRLIGAAHIFRNVTERVRTQQALHESRQRLQLAQRAGRVGIFEWVIPEDRIYWGPELETLYGIPEGSFEGNLEGWRSRVVPEDARRVLEGIEGCLQERRRDYDYEFRALLPDGTPRWLAGHARFFYDEDGAPMRMIGVNIDIDQRKRMEEALRRQEQELRQLNQTLEAQVRARTAELEERNRELQNFAHIASHDLREPLRKIQAFSSMVQEESGDQLGEESSFFLQRMHSAAVRMDGLLSDLLAFSRVTTRAQPLRTVRLEKMVRDVLADYELKIQETGAEVEVRADVTLEADGPQLRQLLTNLVGNAFKYRREDVPLHLCITAEILECDEAEQIDADGPVCRITVADNGIGFEEKYLDRIFEPLQRLHGRGAYEGTGMGLALCRRIVQRHRGGITARSTPGKGSRFLVELPVRAAAH